MWTHTKFVDKGNFKKPCVQQPAADIPGLKWHIILKWLSTDCISTYQHNNNTAKLQHLKENQLYALTTLYTSKLYSYLLYKFDQWSADSLEFSILS